jgi:hypothetical protein
VAGQALMPSETLDNAHWNPEGSTKLLWASLIVVFGLLTGMVTFSTGLLLNRLDTLERQVAIGILPIATERLRNVEYRLDRIEERLNRIESRLQIKAAP